VYSHSTLRVVIASHEIKYRSRILFGEAICEEGFPSHTIHSIDKADILLDFPPQIASREISNAMGTCAPACNDVLSFVLLP